MITRGCDDPIFGGSHGLHTLKLGNQETHFLIYIFSMLSWIMVHLIIVSFFNCFLLLYIIIYSFLLLFIYYYYWFYIYIFDYFYTFTIIKLKVILIIQLFFSVSQTKHPPGRTAGNRIVLLRRPGKSHQAHGRHLNGQSDKLSPVQRKEVSYIRRKYKKTNKKSLECRVCLSVYVIFMVAQSKSVSLTVGVIFTNSEILSAIF